MPNRSVTKVRRFTDVKADPQNPLPLLRKVRLPPPRPSTHRQNVEINIIPWHGYSFPSVQVQATKTTNKPVTKEDTLVLNPNLSCRDPRKATVDADFP